MKIELILSEETRAGLVRLRKDTPNLYKKALKLLDSIMSSPEVGIGKPERLTANLSGLWSRRINDKHRIVYRIDEDTVRIIQIGTH